MVLLAAGPISCFFENRQPWPPEARAEWESECIEAGLGNSTRSPDLDPFAGHYGLGKEDGSDLLVVLEDKCSCAFNELEEQISHVDYLAVPSTLDLERRVWESCI